MRLIDADELLRDAENYSPISAGLADAYDVKWLVDAQTTVDAVEVVHGRWVKGEADKHGNRKPICSVCGEYHLAWWSDYTHCNFCPNCGADMRGDGNG